MATVTAGNSYSQSVSADQTIAISVSHNSSGRIRFTPINTEGLPVDAGSGIGFGPLAMSKTFGPWGQAGTVTIFCDVGTVTYTINPPTFYDNPVLSGGTANGVAYLNGSKALTTGSALTFDGTNLSNTRSVATTFSGTNPATWANGIILTNNATPASGLASFINFGSTGNVNTVFGTAQGSGGYGEFVWAGYGGAFSDWMRLNSTGLGIGTTNPLSRIHGVASSNGIDDHIIRLGFAFNASSESMGSIGTHNDSDSAGGLKFSTASGGTLIERARITSGGYFKASNDGTYNDAAGAYHELRQTADGVALRLGASNASQTNIIQVIEAARNTTNNTFYAIGYYNSGAAAFKLLVADSGNVTNANNSYGAISDQKLKQDIVDASSQWGDIKGLRVRKFRYKADPDGPLQLGLIAQEAETVSPGLVEEHQDFEEVKKTREVEKTREVTAAVLDEEGNVVEPAVTETYTETEEYTERVSLDTTTKAVKYSVLYMKAVKALQEAMERIEKLEAKVASLGVK